MYMKLIRILQFIVYTIQYLHVWLFKLSVLIAHFVVHFRTDSKVHSFTIESPSIHALPSICSIVDEMTYVLCV